MKKNRNGVTTNQLLANSQPGKADVAEVTLGKSHPILEKPTGRDPASLTHSRPALNLYKDKRRNKLSIIIGFVMIIDGAFSLIYGAYATRDEMIPSIIIWALGPPIYFLLEYQLLFDNWDDKEKVDHLRHMQSLAEKVWAAVLFLLVLLYFHEK
jgi:hypothetical protein